MFMEVYYEHYAENATGAYWEEKESIPYMVLEHNKDQREKFKKQLEAAGFWCVSWNGVYPGILVNTELKRFAMIEKACHHSCVNDRNYSIKEFNDEILSCVN